MSGFSKSLHKIEDPYAYLALNVFLQAFRDVRAYFSGDGTPEEIAEGKVSLEWLKRMDGNFTVLALSTRRPIETVHQLCMRKIHEIKKEAMRDIEFKKNLIRGQKVEREILKWVRKNVGEAKIMEGYFPDYDIHCPDVGNIEVKEDRMAHGTGNYAIEFEYKGKPSGIAKTKAETYILVDYEYVVMIPTYFLKELVQKSHTTNMGWEKKAKGYLIPREKVLNSPVAKVVERWFDLWLK